MFGSAYVVDVLADGEQVFDSGVIDHDRDAHALYDTVLGQLLTEQGDPLNDVGERTIRLIDNGNIIREATCFAGVVLAELA